MRIMNSEKVTTGLLASEPPSTRETAFVYQNRKGNLREVMNGEQLSRMEIRANRYLTRYSIAMVNYFYRHKDEYPTKDPGKTFRMTVQFNVFVNSPIKVVEYDVSNIQQYLNDNISYWIAPIVRDYAIEDFRKYSN
ncbi:hypothetical protein ACI2OX_04725 [Bacillus sp. N9]